MKGILFNVLEDAVEESLSEQAWDAALCRAHLEGAYTSLGNYPTDEMRSIVVAIAQDTGLPEAELMRTAGHLGYRHLADRHHELTSRYPDFGSLLENLDTVIHPEVLKLYPEARPPRFDVERRGDAAWRVTYRSERGLCALAAGLMQGAAESFGERVTIEEVQCVHDDHAACIFEVGA